jgi:hypothetical protein
MDLHLGGGHCDSFVGRNNLFGMNIGVDETNEHRSDWPTDLELMGDFGSAAKRGWNRR